MTTKRYVVTSAAIAAIAAFALISATILSPGMLAFGSVSTVQSGQSGTLAVLLTDPPTVPVGVTAVYATYSDVQVHVADAGNESGWYDLHSSGTLNLMGIINVGQTIASTSVPSGIYNLLRFNVTTATVTYNSQNYSARIATNNKTGSQLTVPIIGGVHVTSGQSSAAIIDMTPTVLLMGNSTNPQFAFVNNARAYTIPANSIPRALLLKEHQVNLTAQSWWARIIDSARYQISSASLSPNSLSITVVNTGNVSEVFRLAAVTATISHRGGDVGRASVSEYFVVEPNATLAPITATSKIQIAWVLAAGGYLVPPGATVTFTYSGPIVTGSLAIQSQVTSRGTTSTTQITQNTPQPVVDGQSYVITISGDGSPAQTEVVAS
ncbi:MAG: DUF4382 domain-containing protein [Nitrososphaerota archaeon]|nr:DUF4382 domain-containing protein [Nitrososphaerota archaeon]